jgi:formylglycine-generating enzyme required for sulfatase activity
LVRESTAEIRFIPGGMFRMGSDRHYPEEAPARQAAVADFWIDRTPVTNRQFRKFVNETGHVTLAELPPDAKDYPGALPEMLKAGSLIFASPRGPVDLRDWSQWWQFKFGANWRRPYGPRSSISGLDDHPSFTSPVGMRKPTRNGPARRCRPKPNGNLRARGGLDGAEFAWGEDFTPGGKHRQHLAGRISRQNLAIDGTSGLRR